MGNCRYGVSFPAPRLRKCQLVPRRVNSGRLVAPQPPAGQRQPITASEGQQLSAGCRLLPRFWRRFQRHPRVGLNPARLRGIRTLAQRLRGRSEGLALDRRGPPRFGRGLSRPPGECACRRAIPRMRWSGLRGAAAQRARRAVSASTTPPAGEGTGTAGAWSRRTAYLHGLPDDYILPDNYNEACHLTGDGVVVSTVRFLADALIEPRGLAQSRRGEADSPGNKPTSSTSPLFWHQEGPRASRPDGVLTGPGPKDPHH